MTREEAIKTWLPIISMGIDNMPELKEALDMAIKSLEQEPKKGHWIKYDKEYFAAEKLTPVIHSIRECSECHTRIADFCGEMKYCPNCGVKMESEDKHE